MELKIDFKWTQINANGMFKMSAERHKIIITGWHITGKTKNHLKNGEKRHKTSMRRVKSVQSEAKWLWKGSKVFTRF